MNAQSSIQAEDDLKAELPSDPDGARTERLLRVLERLTDLGMELAEGLAARVKADDVGEVGEVGAAFARISRAVRMTVMLEDRLAKAWRLRQAGIAETHEARRRVRLQAQWAEESEADNRRVEQRQNAIHEAVRDVIRAERPEGFERERLFGRLDYIWVTDLDAEEDLYLDGGGNDALVSEQVAAFCKELGLTPDWDLWKQTFWALEEAEDRAAGSPYAAGGTGPPDG
jgi:hypothetical protein